MRPVMQRALEHIKLTSDQPNIDIVPVLEKELESHYKPQYQAVVSEYEIERTKRKPDISIWDVGHPIDILSDYTPHQNARRSIGFAMMYLYDIVDDTEETIRLKMNKTRGTVNREIELLMHAVAILKSAAAMLRDVRQEIYNAVYK